MSENHSNSTQYRKQLWNKLESKELSLEELLLLNEDGLESLEIETLQRAKKWARDKLITALQGDGCIRILRKVPFNESPSRYPLKLSEPVGDECVVVFLDVETTGLSHDSDKLIELGLVKLKYSPSKKLITSIELVVSEYQDPGMPIPREITELTGITNEDTDGKKIDPDAVRSWLENEDTYVIAHNARFDRPFFSQLIGGESYRWGCSASQIEWRGYKEHKIESAKLEYILLKLGYFYTGHRASVDCLAMVQMFLKLPEALAELIGRVDEDTILIEAKNSPFGMKDHLKEAGYRWNADKRVWSIEVRKPALSERMKELDGFVEDYSSDQATQTVSTARERFKKT